MSNTPPGHARELGDRGTLHGEVLGAVLMGTPTQAPCTSAVSTNTPTDAERPPRQRRIRLMSTAPGETFDQFEVRSTHGLEREA